MFVGPVVPDKPVKFGDPRLKRFQEIPLETVQRGTFDGFFRDNFRPEVVSDVISGRVCRRIDSQRSREPCAGKMNMLFDQV